MVAPNARLLFAIIQGEEEPATQQEGRELRAEVDRDATDLLGDVAAGHGDAPDGVDEHGEGGR